MIMQVDYKRILQTARSLIADEANWATGTNAKDVFGNAVLNPFGEHAVSFCLQGCLLRASWEESGSTPPLPMHEAHDPVGSMSVPSEIRRVIGDLLFPLGFSGFASFNDDPTTTHSDVLSVLDAAIERFDDANG